MADIFISYSSEDKTRVKAIAVILEQKGWTVWWDRQIPVGKRYDNVIEEELNNAKCVIVIWTKRSVASEWVKNEASEAAQREILAPLLLEDVKIPLAFRRIEAARLIDWNGAMDYPELEVLFNAVSFIINGEKQPTLNGTLADNKSEYTYNTQPKSLYSSAVLKWIAAALTGLIALVGSWYYYQQLLPEKIESGAFYFILAVLGASAGALATGAIHAYTALNGIRPGTRLKFAGPVLGLLLFLVGAFYLPKEPEIFIIHITGRVKTAAEIPITDAEISVDGSRFYTKSITDGTYNLELENYKKGVEITLTTSHKNFEDKTTAVKISGREMSLDFVLNPVSP
ncbi:MAG TPA: TIR domain-containing protein [Agriterribacter sp.]|nr:TIR domain-containing protein [Agriterribacter sp.]